MPKKKRRKQRTKKAIPQDEIRVTPLDKQERSKGEKVHKKKIRYIYFLLPVFLALMVAVFLYFFLLSPKFKVQKDSELNICLITLDTTRADRIGCYGYDQARTPNMDFLASNGVRFANTYCQVPLTLPSHCSLFTGTYPLYHQVHNNGSYELDPRYITLAEVLREKGYRTAAFVSSFTVDSRFGLDQGFEFYDDTFQVDEIIKNYRSERRAAEVFSSFSDWFENNHAQKFFCWIHFFDPHLPYDPPSPFREEFSERPYDGEIAYMDVYIGKVIEKLRGKNLFDRTLFILVGDHGEALREKKELDHGIFIYDTTLKVPLIFNGAKTLPSGLVIDSRARLIDVMPTIFDLLSISPETEVQGRSLVPYIEGRKKEDLPSYIETYYPRENFGWSELTGLIDKQWKYIRAPKEELYDIKADPAEENNIIASEKKATSAMKKKFQEFIEKYSSRIESQKKNLTAEEVERLRSLGYMATEYSDTEQEGSLPDPKDRIDEFHILYRAKMAEFQQDYDQAIKSYEEIITLEPRMPMNYYHLALVYMKLDRYPEAAEVLKKGVQNVPNPYVLLSRLAVVYIRLNKIKEAQEASQAALTIKPDHLDSLISSGWIMNELGKPNEAVSFYQRALEIEPENKRLQLDYAYAVFATGRIAEALNMYEKLKAVYPDDYKIYEDIGIALAARGDFQEALINFKKAVELNPAPVTYLNYAVMLERTGFLRDAIHYLKLYLETTKEGNTVRRRDAEKALVQWQQRSR